MDNNNSSISRSKYYLKIFWTIISFIILFVLSKLLLRGSGLFTSPKYIDILLTAIFILFLNNSKKSYYFILLPIIVVISLYTPIGINFGSPKYQHIISFYATEISETKEFLGLIPIKHYLYALASILLIIIYRIITVKYQIFPAKNKLFTSLAILFVFYKQAPLMFFTNTYNEYINVKKELKTLDKYVSHSDWGTSQLVDSKYDDYILIIGESVRSDYMNTYGYPVNNTPFINSSKATIINGFTASGGYTIGSLKHILTKSDKEKWKENYSLNIVDLIKSAGIKTYWLSNQGFLGKYDSPITSIANRSDFKSFLKSGSYDSKNTSDMDLIPKFEQLIKEKTKEKRFFFIHLIGSHPNACDRLTDYHKLFNDKDIPSEYTYINCYVSSIHKTDLFLEKIYNILNKNNRKFSMIYFSDHGLGHKKNGDKLILTNNPGIDRGREYYTVPLIKLSSDDVKQEKFDVFKSGLNFTEGVANWVGIVNPLIDKNLDLFNNKKDSSDYGQIKRITERFSSPDPAIDITPKLQ